MRIMVHDFAGHAFPFQLSQELARRGHEVLHSYFADLPGPKGNFASAVTGNTNLSIEPLRVSSKFNYYSYRDRLWAHHEYVGLLNNQIDQFRPQIVLSGQSPTDVQYRLNSACRKREVRFVHWIQDFYALALETFWKRKFGWPGKAAAAPLHFLERRIFQRSDHVVYISEDFSEYAVSHRYSPKRSSVIENWASLDALPIVAKKNAWSMEHGLDDKFVFLYSGTMGLKHNPHLLADLAFRFRDDDKVRIVLVSEGIGRQALEERKAREGLDNLLLIDFQPYAQLPQVLATADVLLANVEPESSMFCVPSKILNYMCAGKPIVMSVPVENLAARMIERAHAGTICPPDSTEAFLEAAESYWSDRNLRQQTGNHARRYAERTFDIGSIGDRFEALLRESFLPETGDNVSVRQYA